MSLPTITRHLRHHVFHNIVPTYYNSKLVISYFPQHCPYHLQHDICDIKSSRLLSFPTTRPYHHQHHHHRHHHHHHHNNVRLPRRPFSTSSCPCFHLLIVFLFILLFHHLLNTSTTPTSSFPYSIKPPALCLLTRLSKNPFHWYGTHLRV